MVKTLNIMVILAILSMSFSAVYGGEFLPELKTKPKTIAIFKNGLGFFIREGETNLSNGWAMTENVPSATLGTFWISSINEGSRLEEAVAFTEDIKKETDTTSIEELLNINAGKKVTIKAGNEVIEGTIKQLSPSSSMVIIATQDGEIAINKGNITQIKCSGNFNTKTFYKESGKRIKFKVTGKEKSTIRLAYLQKGITWTPSYLVNIENPDKAKITMTSTLINDVEDLENADISFVVGYPNFMFSDILSPMALTYDINQFMSSLNRDRTHYNQNLTSNIAAQSVVYNEPEMNSSSLDYGYATGTQGSSEEDLFLYEKKGVYLKKGERAQYPIFSADVAYKHIYEWDIPDTMQQNKKTEQIWHSVKLDNSSGYPWTTAPAFVVSGLKAISQDIINYTPKGTQSNLKLTIATDVKADRKEFETERQRDIKLKDYYNYDLVTVQGELYIKNTKNKDIVMVIEKKLKGEVLQAGNDGKITKVADGLTGVNYNSVINWEIPVKAGEKIQVTYKYKVYVSH